MSAILPGPYDIPVYRCMTAAVVTNKCPQLPYRGVARPNVCYAMELMIDAIARRIGREPYEVRLANLVRPEQMPYDNVTDKHFDSGDYPRLLRLAVEAIGLPAVRARQERGETDGRLIGLGISVFSEQTAHGTTADGKRRALYEQAFARLTPDGRLDVRVGIQNIGQGLETTLAQIASQYLGIDPSDVHVKLGDTEISPYSSGAWGSRGIVWAGGATARACQELAGRVAKIGAAMLQTDVASVAVRDGGVFGPRGSVSLGDIARAFYLAPADLPGDIDSHGLEVTEGYAPKRLTGVHTGSVHATVVAVDPETGGVEILDYVVVEDAGVLVNPMVVDGQILRRHRAGHRLGAVRGNAVRRARAAAGIDARGLSAAGMPGGSQYPHPAYGNTLALYRVRTEGGRGGRRDRTGRGNRQRRERRLAEARRRAVRDTDHAAAHPGGAVAYSVWRIRSRASFCAASATCGLRNQSAH